MTRSEIVAFFARRQQHWAARDPEGLAGTHAADGTVSSPIFKQLKGRWAIADSYRRLFETFSDWDFQYEDLIIDGDRIAQAFTVRATHTGDFMGLAGTGRRCQIQGVLLFRIADGLIQDERRVYDFTNLLMQIGVLKSKPGY
jgi:predicted ester cyclase